jgi:LPS O-antigen subunit length determinant protein (WzzB/FepE family)
MKQNSTNMQDGEINLKEIIQKLWKKKFLIFFVSLIFAVTGYVYGVLQPKIYKSEIILREAPNDLFSLNNFFFNTRDKDVITDLNEEIKLNLLSRDNLIKFYESNNKITDLKNYLKEKNISISNYFEGKLNIEFETAEHMQKYSLTFTKPLAGENFLTNYVNYVKKKTFIEMKKQLIKKILNEINFYEHNLKIAEIINLSNPILQSTGQNISLLAEPEALFYRGTKVLSQELIYLNLLLNDVKNTTYDNNIILHKATPAMLITKEPHFIMVISFIFGLFLSFIIVFLKSTFKRKT